jgi:hypothetical protein
LCTRGGMWTTRCTWMPLHWDILQTSPPGTAAAAPPPSFQKRRCPGRSRRPSWPTNSRRPRRVS